MAINNMNDILYIVVPCFNEEECILDSSKVLKDIINELINENKINKESKILFVDDGSKDKTWDIISNLHKENKIFSGLKLAKNRGHQNACVAGLEYANDFADMTITIDADLQDDPKTIKDFVNKYYEGYQIVYGVRKSRKTDTFFKRKTAQSYYKLLRKMGIEIIYNHADYRLMSKKAVQELLKCEEKNLFLRGLVPSLGYKSTTVTYDRLPRLKGESKYTLKKMLHLAWDGITSFSLIPLKIILNLGIFLLISSIISLITFSILFATNILNLNIGAYIIMSMGFFSGIILISLGIVAQYIGKIYQEVKKRPRYHIEEFLNDK